MEAAEVNRTLLSRFISFICCASCCKDDEHEDDDLVITRVYQSKSLTELNTLKRNASSPKAVRSETTAAEVEKAASKEKKNKRRFWHFGKWGKKEKEEQENPSQEEVGEIEIDMADGESLPEEDFDDDTPGLVLMDGDAGNIATDNLIVQYLIIH